MTHLQEYLSQTYPRVSERFFIERRNVGMSVWTLHGTLEFKHQPNWDDACHQAYQLSNADVLCRAIDRKRSVVYYPQYEFLGSSDRPYTPALWRGVWRDDQRGQLLDVLIRCDPNLYPLDLYRPWLCYHWSHDLRTANYGIERVGWQHPVALGNSFVDFIPFLEGYYEEV